MLAAGADNQSLCILTSLVNFGLSLVCIKAPSILQRIGLSKKGAIILSFINFCAWIPLALVFLLVGVTPFWFALFWFINLVPTMLLSVQRDNWLTNMVPQNSLGRYLGQRLSIKSMFYLGAFCLFGYMLDSFGENRLIGFAFTFIIAFLAAALDFVIYTYMHETAKNPVETPQFAPEIVRFNIFDYLSELKEQRLKTFITFTSCIYLTVGLCGPLYAAYMMRELYFSYLSFTLIICAEYLARIISLPYWGRYADSQGNIRVIGIAARVIPLIPLFWLFSSNLAYLAVVQLVSGTCWGAFDLCTNSYLYKMAPSSRKLHYITYTRGLILISTVVGGLASFYVIQHIFTIFGSTLLSMFLISAILRGLAVKFIFPKLIDLAVVYDQPKPTLEVSLSMIDEAAASKRGLLYRQRAANLCFKNQETPKTYDVSNFIPISRKGLYYQISSMTPHTSQVTMDYMNKDNFKKIPGLYHDRTKWSTYKKNTLREILKEKLGNGKTNQKEVAADGIEPATKDKVNRYVV